MLLLRGQELTTFHGHANIYGTSRSDRFPPRLPRPFDERRHGRCGRRRRAAVDQSSGPRYRRSLHRLRLGRAATPWDRIERWKSSTAVSSRAGRPACRSGTRASTKGIASPASAAATITARDRRAAMSARRPRLSSRRALGSGTARWDPLGPVYVRTRGPRVRPGSTGVHRRPVVADGRHRRCQGRQLPVAPFAWIMRIGNAAGTDGGGRPQRRGRLDRDGRRPTMPADLDGDPRPGHGCTCACVTARGLPPHDPLYTRFPQSPDTPRTRAA